jgi:chromosomal replication initiator protein
MINTKLNSGFTFDNFIVKDSNMLALSAMLAVGQESMEYNNPMFLYGESGSGKTHLLKSIVRKFKQANKKSVLYATADEFCADAIFAIRNGQRELFEKKYRNNYLLIIDDFQSITGKEKTQEELLIVLKELQIKNRLIILAADCHLNSINRLNDMLADFCHGGLMLEIK